ncbi:MAG: alpha-amylase family glycosyl hydrolase [Planctomycetota bacterium]
MTPQASTSPKPWHGIEPVEVAAGAVGQLPPSVSAVPGREPGIWNVSMALPTHVEGESCHLAGDFNHWSSESHPMERTGDGRWRIDLELPSGEFRYKFCVDGHRWIPDPDNPEGEDDGFESHNSILRLGALGRVEDLKSAVGDGQITTEALEHDPKRPLYLHRVGPQGLRFRYRTLARDVSGVKLLVRELGEYSMVPITSPSPFQYWETTIELGMSFFEAPADAGLATEVEYAFAFNDLEHQSADPRQRKLTPSALPRTETPDWTKEAIWYQIFPERFCNGDPTNDPDVVRPWTSAWYEPSDFEGQDGQTFWEYFVYQRMYGGDLKGIEQRLDHLVELGVTAIYLNPIFQAEGPHKYNATDFRHIDTRFGAGEDYLEATKDERVEDPSTWTWTPSDRLFLDFLKTVKARGLRVILDAVFNHVGVQHPAFKDVAEKREASPYVDWFKIKSWDPFEYAGWAGFGELPVFAKTDVGFRSESVRDHVFAVTRRWMDPDGDGDPSDGIDGWRLDVPMELAPEFWAEWRKLVKSINPDAYITGEIWDRADAWLTGEHFDAVMNYRFAEPVIAWVANREKKISASELDRRLLEIRLAYPDEIGYALMNLVNSHDTDRVAQMVANPDLPYDRSNTMQQNPQYDCGRPGPEAFQRVRLIALLQMTYLGAPMIYYGDEVGMWGADDPTNRQPMIWKDLGPYDNPGEVYWDDEHFAHYRNVVALRRRFPVLRRGTFRTWVVDDEQDLFVFVREAPGEQTVLVALNASEDVVSFDLPPSGHGAWSLEFGAASNSPESPQWIRVEPLSGCVWSLDGSV